MFKNTDNYQIKMKKSGIGHHLDWIIGISLFMLYVVFMIVTIKPGIQPLHKGNTLLSIIQDRFTNATTWNVTKVPLAIKPSCISEANPSISISYPFCSLDTKTNIVDKGNSPISFSIKDACSVNAKLIVFYGTSTIPGKKEYSIVYSNSPEFKKISGAAGTFCAESANYQFGIPELITGLSEDRIRMLETDATTDYEKLKKDLNYPVTNDFIISVKGGGINRKIRKVDPPENVNVYVKQFPEFILESTGERIPVTLTIKVW